MSGNTESMHVRTTSSGAAASSNQFLCEEGSDHMSSSASSTNNIKGSKFVESFTELFDYLQYDLPTPLFLLLQYEFSISTFFILFIDNSWGLGELGNTIAYYVSFVKHFGFYLYMPLALMEVIAWIVVMIEVLTILLIFLTMRYMKRGSLLGPVFKNALFFFLSIFVLGAIPIITIQMKTTGCNTAIGTLDTENGRLTYYPTEPCYSVDAIANSFCTGIMMILLVVINAYATFFVNTLNPRKLFGTEAPFFQPLYCVLVLALAVFAEYFDKEFAFLTPILYSLLNLAFLLVHLIFPVFYSIEGNAQKVSSFFIRFGIGLTFTVSYSFYYLLYFITGSTKIEGHNYIQYIGVAILAVGFILSLIGYILSFVLYEFAFRFIVGPMFNAFGERCKKINNYKVSNNNDNDISDEFYDMLDDAKWFASKSFLLSPCLGASMSSKPFRKNVDEIIKALPMLKVEFRSKFYSKIALYYIFHKGAPPETQLYIHKGAVRIQNFTDLIAMFVAEKFFDKKLGNCELTEVRSVLHAQRKKEERINLLFERFWRETLNDCTNKEIMRLNNLVSQIKDLKIAVNSIYKNLAVRFPNQPVILKHYGLYLKEIAFEEQKGDRMLAQAQRLEEDTGKERSTMLLSSTENSLKSPAQRRRRNELNTANSRNSLGSSPANNNSNKVLPNVNSTGDMSQTETSDESGMDNGQGEAKGLQKADSGMESIQSNEKKLTKLRQLVKQKKMNLGFCALQAIYTLFPFMVFLIASMVCAYFGMSTISGNDEFPSVCEMSGVSYDIINALRVIQAQSQISPQTALYLLMTQLYPKMEIPRTVSRVDSLTFSVKSDFFANYVVPFHIPLSNANFTSAKSGFNFPRASNNTGPTFPGNNTNPPTNSDSTTTSYETRYINFNQIITAYADACGAMFDLSKYPITSYYNTIYSRDFLILYYNVDTMADALFALCQKYNEYTVLQITIATWVLWSTIVLSVVALVLMVIVCTGVNILMDRKKDSAGKVFFHISKDVLGHIFQSLKKKNQASDRRKFGNSESHSSFSTYNVIGLFALPVVEYAIVFGLLFIVVDVAVNGLIQKGIEPQVYVKFGDYSRVSNRLRYNFQEWALKEIRSTLVVKTPDLNSIFSDTKTSMDSFSNLVYEGDSALTKLSRVVGYLYSSNFSCVDDVTCFGFHDLVYHVQSEFTEFLGNRGYDKKSAYEVASALATSYSYLNAKLHTIMTEYWKTKDYQQSLNTIFALCLIVGAIVAAATTIQMFLFSNSVAESNELRFMLNFITPQEFEENLVVKFFIKNDRFNPRANKIDSTEKTKSILNVSSGGIIILNLNWKIEFINLPALEMFVLQNQYKNLKNLNITSIFHKSQQNQVRRMLGRGAIFTAYKKRLEKDLGNAKSASVLRTAGLNIANAAQCATTGCQKAAEEAPGSINDDKENNTYEIIGVRELDQEQQFPCLLHVSFGFWKKKTAITMFCRDISIEKKNQSLLEEEKKKSESLLLNILPHSVRQQIQTGKKKLIANYHQDISVIFCQICGIKGIISVGSMKPDQIIGTLNLIVDAFDELAAKHQFEKIKTIGDVYFAVSGLHSNKQNHPESAVGFGIDMILKLESISREHPEISDVSLKVGANTGPATSGVIGKSKFQWDVWGDTINTGSRMESTAPYGRLQISRTTYERVHDLFDFEERANVFVKGKGNMTTYVILQKEIDKRRQQLAAQARQQAAALLAQQQKERELQERSPNPFSPMPPTGSKSNPFNQSFKATKSPATASLAQVAPTEQTVPATTNTTQVVQVQPVPIPILQSPPTAPASAVKPQTFDAPGAFGW